jgi:putative protein kinase ArgK-like GTPase of G3E family
VQTQANNGKGIEEVASAIQRHRSFLEANGALERRRKARLEGRVREIIDDQLHIDFWNNERLNELHRKLELLVHRQSNPYDVAAGLIDDFHTSNGTM